MTTVDVADRIQCRRDHTQLQVTSRDAHGKPILQCPKCHHTWPWS